ncbi:MAG: tetratricopeptide repeat protein [Bacteroidia bacterium]|nr:tetratricopeptide repeat protein [Bacteroidia bacterium]
MSDYKASSLYLACLSSSVKKRSTRQLKAVQDGFDRLVQQYSPTTLIHREGAKDVPFAWDAISGDLVYQQVQLVYFYSDSDVGEELFLSQKIAKRHKLDFEEFNWKAFPDLKIIILDGNYSLDVAEQFLFSGAPAVLLLPRNNNPEAFRKSLFAKLLKGERLNRALESSCSETGIKMPLYTLPSDPYDYWAWKENQQKAVEGDGCLINLTGGEHILAWAWTPFSFYQNEAEESDWIVQEEPEVEVYEAPVEEEEPMLWFEETSKFSTWEEGHLISSYSEVREREFTHIAAKTGDIHPKPNTSVKEETDRQTYALPPRNEPSRMYDLVPVATMEEVKKREEGREYQEEYSYYNQGQGQRQEDDEPQAGSTNSLLSWPVLTWVGLTIALVTLSSIAYVMPGRQTPRLSDFKFLSNFSTSAEQYNVLLLPFRPESAEGGSSWAEETVRDWVNTLPESQELGINVIYAGGSQLPGTAEEAKRIGEIYNANLVIWGDYGSYSTDTSIHKLKYVSPNSIYSKASQDEVKLGAAAFNDVYDLQEGFLTGNIEDINYWILATAYLKKEDYRSAYSNLQQVQASSGRGMAVIHQMMAKCYFGLEYFNDCIQAYSLAIQQDPNNANSYFQRANVYHLTKMNKKAIEDYEETLKINPNHLEAKAKLKKLIEESNKVEVTVPEGSPNNSTSFTLLEEMEAYSKAESSK